MRAELIRELEIRFYCGVGALKVATRILDNFFFFAAV